MSADVVITSGPFPAHHLARDEHGSLERWATTRCIRPTNPRGNAHRPLWTNAVIRAASFEWPQLSVLTFASEGATGSSWPIASTASRLVHYRNTWYLDAWCHSRERLLRFALDAIESADALETKSKNVPLKQVEADMGGYGIYGGAKRQWAKLVFQPQAAQWVSRLLAES